MQPLYFYKWIIPCHVAIVAIFLHSEKTTQYAAERRLYAVTFVTGNWSLHMPLMPALIEVRAPLLAESIRNNR